MAESPLVCVTIEIPRGSFLKRGSDGHVDFVSPFPCPFNYGSVAGLIGGEGDLLDAVVLGRRLPVGTEVLVPARGSVGLAERFMRDDKLICSTKPLSSAQRRWVLRFFHFYAACKGGLNIFRGQRGASSCLGWDEAETALARAVPDRGQGSSPRIHF